MESKSKKTNSGLFVYIGILVAVFFFACPIYPSKADSGLFQWLSSTWNAETDFVHGWAVPVLFIVFCRQAWKLMQKEPLGSSKLGLGLVIFGLLCYLASMRTMQPRVAFIGLPFIILGGVAYTAGWARAKHMIFTSFFWYFAVPVPGLQQATNILQLFVSKGCYLSGKLLGMDLVLSGSEIYVANSNLDIAAGCSGIRSLMALVMIAAIYAYYSQDKWWKRAVLFSLALPLSMLGNYVRVFSILVITSWGFEDFATGIYHDFSGLLFFFPVALLCLYWAGSLLSGKKKQSRVKTRVIS